jgi:TP901 family phage tail tape measure protein
VATPAAVLHVLVQANTAQATAGLNKFNSQLYATEAQSRRTTGAMKSMAKATAGGLGLAAIGGGLVAGTRAFVDFDRSMRNVNSIAKLNEKDFKSLSKQVRDLAGPTAQAPKTLADGMYQLVSSGVKAKDAIKVLRQSAIAATAGITDTATATRVIVGALNAYSMEVTQAGKVSDVLFKTVELGALSFEELAQGIGPVLATANKLGVTLQEVGAAAATLTIKGFPAAEAFTAIDASMRALTKPSEAMKKAFSDLGVASGEELIQKFGSYQAALNAVAKTTDGSSAAMNKLFNEIRGSRGALTLTGNNAKVAAGHLREMSKASGASMSAFKEQMKSVGAQWQRLKAQLSAGAVEIGATLLPVLNKIVGAIITWRQVTKSSITVIARFLKDVWNKPKEAFQNSRSLAASSRACLRRPGTWPTTSRGWARSPPVPSAT